MSDFEEQKPSGVSRRTVTKAMAWAAPVIAVAATVPFAAASELPPPVFNWALGCATVGNSGGCANLKFGPQVPFTIENTTGQTLQFQVLGQKSWTDNSSEPANFTAATGIYTNNGTENNCTPQVGFVGCNNVLSVTVEAGEELSLWIVGSALTNASAFWMKVNYQWIAEDCETVVNGPTVASAPFIVPNNNCDV